MSLFFLYMFILILFLLGKFLVDEHAEQAHRWLEATAHLPKNRRAHRRLALRYRARWQPWSRARMPWPLHLAMPVLARTRSPRRRRPEQQSAAARGTASRADGGSQRTKPASSGLQASRSRPCGRPTAARSWPVAGERRAVSRTTTAGEPTACARLSFILEYGSRKWWRAPQNSGTGLALGARSCYKQLGYSVFSLIHVAWL